MVGICAPPITYHFPYREFLRKEAIRKASLMLRSGRMKAASFRQTVL